MKTIDCYPILQMELLTMIQHPVALHADLLMNPSDLETDPALLILQAKIRAAADRDDAAGMAAACLAHARLVEDLGPKKPLEALALYDVPQVLAMSNDSAPATRVLWQLVILRASLDLQTADGDLIASELLKHLNDQIGIMTTLWGTYEANAAWIIESIFPTDSFIASRLATALLSDARLALICRKIALLGQSDAALAMANNIVMLEGRSCAYADIAAAQWSAGLTAAAEGTLDLAAHYALQVTESVGRANALVKAARGFASIMSYPKSSYLMSEAFETAVHADYPEAKARLLASIAPAQALIVNAETARRSLLTALSIAHELDYVGSRSELFSTIARSELESEQITEAATTVSHARTTAREIPYKDQRESAISEVIKLRAILEMGVLDSRDLSELASLGPYCKIPTLLAIAVASLQAGHVEHATALFSDAIELTPMLDSTYSIVEAYLKIALAFSALNRHEDAARVIFQACACARDDAHGQIHGRLARIASVQAEVGFVKSSNATLLEALTTASQWNADWAKSRAISNIWMALQDCESEIDARRISQELLPNWFQGQQAMMHRLHRSIWAATEMPSEDAAASLAELLESARQSFQDSELAIAIALIACAQQEIGLLDESLNAAAEAVNWAYHEDSEDYRAQCFLDIASIFAPCKLYDAARAATTSALSCVPAIEDPWERFATQSRAAAILSLCGSSDTALEITDGIDDPGFRAFTYWRIEWHHAGPDSSLHEFATAAIAAAYQIKEPWWRDKAISEAAEDFAKSGHIEKTILLCDILRSERTTRLAEIARVVVSDEKRLRVANQSPQYTNFKRMLVPCSYYVGSSYAICGLLADIYPEQVREIARAVVPP